MGRGRRTKTGDTLHTLLRSTSKPQLYWTHTPCCCRESGATSLCWIPFLLNHEVIAPPLRLTELRCFVLNKEQIIISGFRRQAEFDPATNIYCGLSWDGVAHQTQTSTQEQQMSLAAHVWPRRDWYTSQRFGECPRCDTSLQLSVNLCKSPIIPRMEVGDKCWPFFSASSSSSTCPSEFDEKVQMFIDRMRRLNSA